MSQEYFAFISYSSKDIEWGKRVQQKLEHYRLPAAVCRKYGYDRIPVKPVFFAPSDIQPGGLNEELKERLRASRNLIVICSPNSAASEWVGKEIRFFHELGRTDHIHFFIVDGIPHSGQKDTDCFNPVIKDLGIPEILGANIHEKIFNWSWLNRERAYVQLITKLLGVEFDEIWQRHKRLIVSRVVYIFLIAVAVLSITFGMWFFNKPVDVSVHLNEASVYNPDLPPIRNAIVSMSIANETKTDTISSVNDKAFFRNIPHKYINSDAHMIVVCEDYCSVDTILPLSAVMTLNLRRDSSRYGDIRFILWDPHKEKGVPNKKIFIEDIETESDRNGIVSLHVPLALQRQSYRLKTDVPLEDTILYMPCTSPNLGISIK